MTQATTSVDMPENPDEDTVSATQHQEALAEKDREIQNLQAKLERMRDAYRELARERDRQEELALGRVAHKLSAAEAARDTMEERLREIRADAGPSAEVLESLTWRTGRLFAEAVEKPFPRLFKLPFQILALRREMRQR